MAVLELCILSWFSMQAPVPQEPVGEAPPTTTNAARDPVAWLPADTLVAVGFRVGETDTLEDIWTHLGALVASEGGPVSLEGDTQRMLAAMGLTTGDVAAIARGGVALGVTGFSLAGPKFVCVANLSEAGESVRGTLAALAGGNWSGIRCEGGVFGEHLVFGSSSALVEASRAAISASQPDGLSTTPDYVAAARTTPTTGAPVLTAFMRPAALFEAVIATLPAPQSETATRIAEAMSIGALERAMLRIGLDGEGIEVVGSCSVPPEQSPLTCLFTGGPPLTTALANLVPAEATSFAFSSFDFAGFARRTLDLIEADPTGDLMLASMTVQLRESTGVDLRSDLLTALTGMSINLRVPTGQGTLLGVTDGERFAATVQKLLAATPLDLGQQTVHGATAWQFAVPGAPTAPTIGVAGDWFCFAEDYQTFAAIAQQVARPSPDPEAASVLAGAEPGMQMLFATADGSSRGVMRQAAGEARFVSHWRPNGAPRATTDTPPQPTGHPRARADLVLALQEAELNPDGTTVEALAHLAMSTHSGVAARAAWLLGRREDPATLPLLTNLVSASPHPEVRVQAMHALLRAGTPASAEAAVAGLDDGDVRVRTMAAQLVGRLRQPETIAPLLAALTESAQQASTNGPSTDLQAMLLALSDMQAADQLLSAAEAMSGCVAPGTDQALAYYFQNQSTRLTPADEATLLVAVLDHSHSMLRRYAIGRLGELRDQNTVKALERRLAAESPELRPLLEVALSQVRQQQPKAPGATDDGGTSAAAPAAAAANPWQRVRARWEQLPQEHKLFVGGIGGLAAFMPLVLILVLARRRRARRRHERTLALTAPSENFQIDEDEELASAAEQLIDAPYDDGDDQTFEDDYGDEQDGYPEDGVWAAAGEEPFAEAEEPVFHDEEGDRR